MTVKKKHMLHALILAWVVIFSYMTCRIFNLAAGSGWKIKGIMGMFLIGGILYVICLWETQKLTTEKLVFFIMYAGFVMRIGYMFYTGCTVRSHDMYDLDVNSYGHAAYLLEIIQNGRLPQDNLIQKYQQPFFYITGTICSKIINGILGAKNVYAQVDAAKTVSCIASCYSLVIAKDIFKTCGLKEKGLVHAMVLAAFLPAFYLAGGRVAPDMLACMFILLAFLYTLRWMNNPTWEYTIKLALIYGCAMMTKISCAVMACVTAVVFMQRLYLAWKEKCMGEYWKKYIVFAGVSLPLGLWFGIRNLVRFGQPLTYVLKLPKNSSIYTGDHSIMQRLFGIQINNLFKSPYANAWKDYNYPVYAVKSALFGEFSYEAGKWIPSVLLSFAVFLAVACMTAILRNRKQLFSGETGIMLFGTTIWMYLNSLLFYIKYPFGCSMDYRYMLAFTIPVAAIFGSYKWKKWEKSIDLLCVGFAGMSCVMYCVI